MAETPKRATTQYNPEAPTALVLYPEHLRLIGLLVSEWSNLEYKLVWLTSFLIGVEQQVIYSMVYANESSRARLNCIANALDGIHYRDTERGDELSAILEEAKSCLTQRNKFAHAVFGYQETGELMILNPREIVVSRILPLYNLEHQYGRITKLSDRVGKLLMATLTAAREMHMRHMQLQGLASSLVSRKTDSGSADPQDPPSPQEPPEPSRQ